MNFPFLFICVTPTQLLYFCLNIKILTSAIVAVTFMECKYICMYVYIYQDNVNVRIYVYILYKYTSYACVCVLLFIHISIYIHTYRLYMCVLNVIKFLESLFISLFFIHSSFIFVDCSSCCLCACVLVFVLFWFLCSCIGVGCFCCCCFRKNRFRVWFCCVGVFMTFL